MDLRGVVGARGLAARRLSAPSACPLVLPQAPLTVVPSVRQKQALGPCSARSVLAHAESNGVASKSNLKHVYYYFDPLNPENVVEVVAKPAQQLAPRSPTQNVVNGYGYNNGGINGQQVVKVDEGKAAMQMQLQVVSQQLEAARKTISKLQQYELLYKESRMQAKQMSSEIATLQALVADKDAELARQYKRMEKEASERSGLRNQYSSTLDEVKALRQDLEEARQAMLELKGTLPGTSRRQLSTPSYSSSNGNGKYNYGAANGSLTSDSHSDVAPAFADGQTTDVFSGLQGLAKQLAEGMEREVGFLGGRREHK